MVIALVAWSGAASASPALDLFNQATYYIQTRYNGFSAAAEQDFAALYRPDLETACAAERSTCPYSVAVPIVDRMLGGKGQLEGVGEGLTEIETNLLDEVIEIVLEDNQVERAIEAIQQAAHTGRIGDGKIFVST
ncbi:MAG: P-II family nitrogen regulator, partial [Pleurocapsa sp. SU_196_0]|nr:P-II family nitrogen regulator [Pleurocapsa sp. SU_196_0]